MDKHLQNDAQTLEALLQAVSAEALRFRNQISEIPASTQQPVRNPSPIPKSGIGAAGALEHFLSAYAPHITASSGPRYWGFVTGGTTPAALLGDWLTSAYDLNLADKGGSAGPAIELETVSMLRELFNLPPSFLGVFVSGATLANFVGLATAREWVSQQLGYSAAKDGLVGHAAIPVLSAEPHSSAVKSMAMLGMGRNVLVMVKRLPGNREAMDVADLETRLATLNGTPVIVLASGGTVNTVDFDDLPAIASLRERFPFWLHVDAAFGGFAACSPRFADRLKGLELADSITIDAHKWLNVPYDSAMIFTQHPALQAAVFQNSGAYLPDLGPNPDFFHLTPENSRRFRALPAWFTLMAYGKDGYREIVERCCELAMTLGERIEHSETFRLLAPVRMNVVCFTLAQVSTKTDITEFLRQLQSTGAVFLTPTHYDGVPGMRAAFVNWQTTSADLALAWKTLESLAVARKTAVG